MKLSKCTVLSAKKMSQKRALMMISLTGDSLSHQEVVHFYSYFGVRHLLVGRVEAPAATVHFIHQILSKPQEVRFGEHSGEL